MNYEAVIGLEVHVQVKTRSKMFTRVATGYGAPANTLTDPVVLGLPGALPVLNRAAVEPTIKAGLMLGCTSPRSANGTAKTISTRTRRKTTRSPSTTSRFASAARSRSNCRARPAM